MAIEDGQSVKSDGATTRNGPLPLRMVVLNLTSNCNLRCKMCSVVHTENHYTLSERKAFEVADFAERRLEVICLTGGEPTIVPYFWELMDRLGRSGLTISLLTNAVRLKQEHIERLSRQPDLYTVISIDGLGDVHDNIRGQKTFAATEAALKAMTEAGLRVGVNTVVQRTNFRTLLEVYEYFKRYPLAWHTFSYAEGYHGKENLSPEDLDESVQYLNEIVARSRKDDRDVTLTEGMIRGFYLAERYRGIPLYPGLGCVVPRHGFHIDAEGGLHPCWHYPWPLDLKEWNIYQRPLDEMVDSPEYVAAVKEAVTGKCPGCATQCYLWDESFKRKLQEWPSEAEAAARAMRAKDLIRRTLPPVFWLAKWCKARMGR